MNGIVPSLITLLYGLTNLNYFLEENGIKSNYVTFPKSQNKEAAHPKLEARPHFIQQINVGSNIRQVQS